MINMKLISLLVILLLPCSFLMGQTRIEGEYSSLETGAVLRTLIIEKENLFTSYSSVIGGHSSFISKGYYLIKKDTLLLFYDSLPYEYPPSSYNITSKSDTSVSQIGHVSKIFEDEAVLNISITSSNGNPMPGCNVIFMSANNRAVFGEVSDEDGEVFVFTQGKLIDNIVISWIGYKSIWISMSELWGFKSSIAVQLELDPFKTFNTRYKIERYIINNDKVTLTLLDKSGQKLTFKKKDS